MIDVTAINIAMLEERIKELETEAATAEIKLLRYSDKIEQQRLEIQDLVKAMV